VSAGRLYGYTDSSCSVSDTSVSFESGTCYPSGIGSEITECGEIIDGNEMRVSYSWRYNHNMTGCPKHWTDSASGWDGHCVSVSAGPGNIRSIRVNCSAAHTTAAVSSLLALLLVVLAVGAVKL